MAKAAANYMNSQLIKMEAVTNGYAEGIALDATGYVSEGSGENIFLVRDGIIYTPALGTSVLPGITRDTVIRLGRDLGFEFREQPIPREWLYIADEGDDIHGVMRVRPDGTGSEIVVNTFNGAPLNGANDLVFGPDGTLYFSDPWRTSLENPVGGFYRLLLVLFVKFGDVVRLRIDVDFFRGFVVMLRLVGKLRVFGNAFRALGGFRLAALAALFGFFDRTRFLFDEALPVGDRDLIVIRMDFAEGEEAVPVAAVVDEGSL